MIESALAVLLVAVIPAASAGVARAGDAGRGAANAGRIVFASELPAYPPPANLNRSRIYSVAVDGRDRRDLSRAPGGSAALSPDRTKIAFLRDGDLWVMNVDGSGQRRLLSPGLQESLYGDEPTWSPDGTKLAVNMEYTSPCTNTAHKCWEPTVAGVIVDLEGTRLAATGLDPAWSPDGTQIVSAVDQSGYPDERDWQIVVSSVDGSASRALTLTISIPDGAYWTEPSWSPDGDRIAAGVRAGCREAFKDVWLRSYVFPVRQGRPRVLVRAGTTVWSPDGTKLALSRDNCTSDASALFVARGDGSRARLLGGADPTGPPVWSSNGERLAYASSRSQQLETVRADGTERRRASRERPNSVVMPFAWSHDGRRILYTAAVVPTHTRLWTMSPTGTGFKQLTSGSRSDDDEPAWSPSGRVIAFTRWTAPNEQADATGAIYAIRRDGAHERLVLGGSRAGYSASGPAWSPDGTRLAFVRTSLDFETVGLYVAAADGSKARRIAGTIDSRPDWSPDGSRIAYGKGGAIALVNPNGTGRKTLARAADDCGEPAWSPNGRRLALVCGDPNNDTRGVYVMNADGSDLGRVIDDTRASSPTWSPDGTTIVFAGVSCLPAGRDDGICAVEANGSGLRALTLFLARSSRPNWSSRTSSG